MAETWTIKKILNWTTDYFTSKNISEPRLSAELLLADVLNCKRIELYVQFERILSADERTAYRVFVQRRAQREPVQYILGETEFMGFPFKVSPAVLIPRPDTELLVDCVINYLKTNDLNTSKILDIGTGSGCIAISLAKYFSEAEVYAIEKSPDAIAIARENAAQNDVTIHFIEDDFFTYVANSSGKFDFDILVSNPPYISEADWPGLQAEVQNFEPKVALFGGKDGMDFYNRLIPVAKNVLASNGTVFLETGYDQAEKVAALLTNEKFTSEIHKDYQQIERVVIGNLAE